MGEGRLVDIGSLMTGNGRAAAHLHHGSGGAADTVIMAGPEKYATGSTTVERMVGDILVEFFVYQPFGPRWIHAHSPGGEWVEAISSEYSVTLYHTDGTVSRVEGPQLLGPRLNPSEHERAQATIDRNLQRFDLGNYPFEILDHKPPLANIFFDQSGRLWVEKTRAEGEEMREADVYAGSVLVARYRWPRRVSVGNVPWVTESMLYGTTRDSLGVPRVARVQLESDSCVAPYLLTRDADLHVWEPPKRVLFMLTPK
ncbi:MAG: hypothetical protein OXD43_15435 [Bacteroidetes bacterium]|nr:hypothetical protein [Bacteroidota bacterium]